jgi:hypothetical protein
MKNIVRAIAVCLLFVSLPAAAQSWDWSAPASSGVPDDGTSSSGLWEFSGVAFQIKANAVSTQQIRFPVTNTVGSSHDVSPAWTTLEMAYADNSSTAGSVVGTLYKIEKCSNTITEMCTITSTDGDGSLTCSTCTFSGGFDFANNAYWVDVTITKTDVPADPKLYEVAVY